MTLKNFFKVFLLMLLSSKIYAKKDSCILLGKYEGKSASYLILKYYNKYNIYKKDTCYIINGKFSKALNINETQTVSMTSNISGRGVDDKNFVEFFIDPNKIIHLEVKENEFKQIIVKGSKVQTEYEFFLKRKEKITHKIDSNFYAIRNLKNDTITINSLKKDLKFWKNEEVTYDTNYMKSHQKSFVSLSLLDYYVSFLNLNFSNKIFQSFDTNLRNSILGNRINEQVNIAKSISEGNQAPAFIAYDINNNYFDVNKIKVKYIIHFWASWCKPCLKEFEALISYYNMLDTNKVKLVFISLDRDSLVWKKMVVQAGINNHFNILNSEKQNIVKLYNVEPIPTTILINNKGFILDRFEGESEQNIIKIKEFIAN